MSVFWLLVGLLTCTATAAIVWPLVSRRDMAPSSARDEEARRLAVYRDRRHEIAADRAAGRLSDEEAGRASAELVAEAAQQFPDKAATADAIRNASPRIALGLVAALVVPLSALTIYDRIGAPGNAGRPTARASSPATFENPAQAIDALRQRVADKPDDGEAWALLADALRIADQHAEAARAYDKAVRLIQPDARLLADFAETLVILANGDFSGRPVELLAQALRVDPRDGKAVALMGAAQYRLGNLEEALRHLRALTAAMDDDSAETRHLKQAVANIEAELAASRKSGKDGGPRGAGGPDAAGKTRSGPQTPIRGSITIDPALSAPAGAVMFIVARPADGSRIPVAAVRTTVGAWPASFELGDAQAMDPARRLSEAGPVVIEARISASGDAGRKPGDLFGVSQTVRAGADKVAIRIDQRVP